MPVIRISGPGIVWLGLFPGPVLRRMEPSARHFVEMTQPAGAARPAIAEVRP